MVEVEAAAPHSTSRSTDAAELLGVSETNLNESEYKFSNDLHLHLINEAQPLHLLSLAEAETENVRYRNNSDDKISSAGAGRAVPSIGCFWRVHVGGGRCRRR